MKKINMLWIVALFVLAFAMPIEAAVCNTSFNYRMPLTYNEGNAGNRPVGWRVMFYNVTIPAGRVTDANKEFAVCNAGQTEQISFDFDNITATNYNIYINSPVTVAQGGSAGLYLLYDCDSCTNNPFRNLSKMNLLNITFANTADKNLFSNFTEFDVAGAVDYDTIGTNGNPAPSFNISSDGGSGYGSFVAYLNFTKTNPIGTLHVDTYFYNTSVNNGGLAVAIFNTTSDPTAAGFDASSANLCTSVGQTQFATNTLACNSEKWGGTGNTPSSSVWNTSRYTFMNNTPYLIGNKFTMMLLMVDFSNGEVGGASFDNFIYNETFNGTTSQGTEEVNADVAGTFVTNISMKNAYDNASISNFFVLAYNGSNSVTSNTTTGYASFTNLTGTYTFNVTIYNYYESFKSFSALANTSILTSISNHSIESLINVSLTIKGTPYLLYGFNASILRAKNTTTSNSVYLISNSSSQFITVSKGGFYTTNGTFSITQGAITSVNISIASNLLVVNATEYTSGAPIADFTITAVDKSTSYREAYTTSDGKAYLFLSNNTYNLTFNSTLYETLNTNISLNNSVQVVSYIFRPNYINSFYLNFYDEVTKVPILNVTVGVISTAYSANYTTQNGTLNILSITPSDYIIRYTSLNYVTRLYYTTLTSQTAQTISLYNIRNSTATTITINLLDQVNNPLSGAILYAYRYDIVTNSYLLVEMSQSNADGKAYLNLELNGEFYKFILNYRGVLYALGTADYVKSTTLNFRVQLGNIFATETYNLVGSVGNIDWDNSTKTATFTYITPTASQGCLEVDSVQNNNPSQVSLTCLSSVSGIINYVLSPANDTTYNIHGYVVMGGYYYELDTFSYYQPSVPQIVDYESTTFLLLFHFILLGAFLFDPIIAIIAQVLPEVLFQSIGFINLGWPFVGAEFALALIIAYLIGSERR